MQHTQFCAVKELTKICWVVYPHAGYITWYALEVGGNNVVYASTLIHTTLYALRVPPPPIAGAEKVPGAGEVFCQKARNLNLNSNLNFSL